LVISYRSFDRGPAASPLPPLPPLPQAARARQPYRTKTTTLAAVEAWSWLEEALQRMGVQLTTNFWVVKKLKVNKSKKLKLNVHKITVSHVFQVINLKLPSSS